MRPQTSRTVSFLAATARALNCAHVGSGSAAQPRSTAGWSAVSGPYLACAAQGSRSLTNVQLWTWQPNMSSSKICLQEQHA